MHARDAAHGQQGPSTIVVWGRLKEKGRHFREAFFQKLALLLRGTVAAPPERFGETLADEHIRGGADLALVCCQMLFSQSAQAL